MQKAILVTLLLVISSLAFAQTAKDTYEPPAELLAWLREHALPLQSAVPTDSNEDLLPLKAMIGEARVVALGRSYPRHQRILHPQTPPYPILS